MRSRRRQLDVPVPGSGLHGRHDQFPALAETGCQAAKYFLQLALWRSQHIRPRVINVDGHPAYPQAIAELKASGELGRHCRCRPAPYLNNVLEQDHRFINQTFGIAA